MPFIEGRRVSLAEWRAHQPVRPVYSVGPSHVIINEPEVREYEDRTAADLWAREENARRHGLAMGAMIPANTVPEVAPADWPGWETPTAESYEAQRREERAATRRSAVADAMGLSEAELDAMPVRPVITTEGGERYDDPTPRTSRARWAAEHPDMPAHDPARPSQRPGASRQRRLRQLARENGTTVAEEAQRRPERQRKNLKARES